MIIEPEKYTERPLKVSMTVLNLLSIPLAAVVFLVFGGVHKIIWDINADEFELLSGTILLGVLVGAAIHEFIHGLVAAQYAEKGWKSLKFGVMWRYLAAYCHCKEALTVKQYRKVALMPSIVALIVMVACVALGWSTLLIISSILFIGGIGDFTICYKIRHECGHALVFDYPDKIGCAIFELKTDDEQLNKLP